MAWDGWTRRKCLLRQETGSHRYSLDTVCRVCRQGLAEVWGPTAVLSPTDRRPVSVPVSYYSPLSNKRPIGIWQLRPYRAPDMTHAVKASLSAAPCRASWFLSAMPRDSGLPSVHKHEHTYRALESPRLHSSV
ncbi:hypothetical protein J6590_030576 [Homalodisca vitripennis]|nr:hypothetical protein J6590_030576 [Homalodisca vitripennis]